MFSSRKKEDKIKKKHSILRISKSKLQSQQFGKPTTYKQQIRNCNITAPEFSQANINTL